MILHGNPKREKTTECFSYIKTRLHVVYQHQLEGGYNPLDLPATNGRKNQLPESQAPTYGEDTNPQ
jgi:hypothetical protein